MSGDSKPIKRLHEYSSKNSWTSNVDSLEIGIEHATLGADPYIRYLGWSVIASNAYGIDPETLALLIESLHQTQSATEALQCVGQILQEQLELQAVWIGYPTVQVTTCYWVINHQAELQPFQIRLGSHLLEQLGQASEQMLILEPDVMKDSITLDLNASLEGSEWQGSAPPHLDWFYHPQLLVTAYPEGRSSWIMGLVGASTEIWTSPAQLLVRTLLQIVALVLGAKRARQQAQDTAQLQRSLANRLMDWFRIASEATRQVIYEWDLHSNQVEWSATLPAVFGHGVTDAVEDRSWWADRIHPDDRDKVLSHVDQAISDLQMVLCEYRWRRADGYYAWVKDYGRVFCGPQGQAVRMIGSLEDITPRHGTAEALNQLKQKFKVIAETATTGILGITPDLRIVDVNTAFLKLLNYDRAGLEQLENLSLIVHPADLDADASELHNLINHQLISYRTQKRFYHIEGHEIQTTIEVTGIQDQKGQIIQLIWQVVPG